MKAEIYLLLFLTASAITYADLKFAYDRQLNPIEFNWAVDLQGTWKLMNANGSVSTTGLVPGSVHTDLLRAGIIEDPYYRFNDDVYRWIGLDDWTYSRTFTLTQSMLSSNKIVLIAEGMDTVSQILINGNLIGTTENMFRRYMFPIASSYLKSGTNYIQVQFTSAETYATKKADEYPYYVCDGTDPPVEHGLPNRNFIRKEQCSFAWDWGPCFIPAGIWLPIGIMAYDDAIITYVVPQIQMKDSLSLFDVTVQLYVDAAVSTTVQYQTTLADVITQKDFDLTPGENVLELTFQVANPDLWWPRGYGDPTMYTLQVQLSSGNQIIDSATRQVGFRDIQLVRDPIQGQAGSSFYIQVNNIPVFAKGANWIPADAFENRVTYDILSNLLQSAADANMNVVRNWGGGIYQHEAFYSICDKLGLMVWEEFMFACAMYPRDSAFLKNVAQEVRHQVLRLSHHPAIIIWSGNNENEVALHWYDSTIANRDLYLVDYVKLYYDTVIGTLKDYESTRPFWPSSPSNGFVSMDPLVGIWENANNYTMGDVHFYNYDMMCNNVSNLPNARFVSEYGFQSYPSIATWLPVTEQSDLTINSSLMDHRQHHQDGNSQIANSIRMHFSLNSNSDPYKYFENFIYLSQCYQAVCITAESEHYRRGKGLPQQTMGAIYWQLNDIWQAPTWSSIEYGGKWKILHYFAKRFFAPVLVSGFEEPYNQFNLHVTSDLAQTLRGSVAIGLWNYQGQQLTSWTKTFRLTAYQSSQVYSNSISSMISNHCNDRSDCFLYISAFDNNGNLLSENYFVLTSLAEVTLVDPQIRVLSVNQTSTKSVSVALQSVAPAPFTTLDVDIQGKFSDNGFFMLPGTKILEFEGWNAFQASDFAQSLTVKSIYDTL